MFQNLRNGNDDNRQMSTRDALHAFAHRRQSWTSRDGKQPRQRFKWHIYDNNGSFNGWFDWLPLRMRVGYWSPVAVMFLVVFYYSIYAYMPQPLEFPVLSREVDSFWWKADCFVGVWCIFVVVYASRSMGSIGGFYISYTGWSWIILASRALLDASSEVIAPSHANLAKSMATLASSLRFPASVAAFVTFTIWNFVLLPIICFLATPPGEKREKFLRFNFGFFMTNIHILNLPLAMVNNIYGGSTRTFGESDLWMGCLVVALYTVLYLFVMDRIGLHFYPIFCPRSASCALSFGSVLYLYYMLMHKGNELILYLNPDLS